LDQLSQIKAKTKETEEEKQKDEDFERRLLMKIKEEYGLHHMIIL